MGSACSCCAAETTAAPIERKVERKEERREVFVEKRDPKPAATAETRRCEREEMVEREGDIEQNEQEFRRAMKTKMASDKQLILEREAAEKARLKKLEEEELRKRLLAERLLREQQLRDAKPIEVPPVVDRMGAVYAFEGDCASSDDDTDINGMFGIIPLLTSGPSVSPNTVGVDLASTNNSLLIGELSTTFSESQSDGSVSRVSSRKSLNSTTTARGGLLSRKPFLMLDLDEVSNRDEIMRETADVLTRLRTQCFYIGTVHTLRLLVHPACEDAHLRFLAAATESEEIKHRYDLESQWLRGALPIYHSRAKVAVLRQEFLRDKLAMEARQRRQLVSKRGEREVARRRDKMKWEVEKARLDAGKLSAMDKLRADLAAVRAVAGETSETMVGHMGRNTRAIRRRCVAQEDEEDRLRCLIEAEEDATFNTMHDICAQEMPCIVNHPNKAVYQARKDTELSDLIQLKNRLESRLQTESFAEAERIRLTREEFVRGKLSILVYDSDNMVQTITQSEQEEWDALMEAEEVARIVVGTHAWRVKVRAREKYRDDREDALFRESHEKIRRIGRGFQWRRRIGLVHPCREEILRVILKEERARKHLKQKEHIAQGDLLHYCILEARLAFPVVSATTTPSIVPPPAAIQMNGNESVHSQDRKASEEEDDVDHNPPVMSGGNALLHRGSVSSSCTAEPVSWEVAEMYSKFGPGEYPWDPSVTEPVEVMAREDLVEEFFVSFDENISKIAAAEVRDIMLLPSHMVGARERSARKIQNLFKGFIHRRNFIQNEMDEMVLAKMGRLQRKTQMRLVLEVERKRRYEITLEYEEMGLHRHATMQELFKLWKRERLAAINVQRVFRGYAFRQNGLDEATLKFLRSKWANIKDWIAKGAPAGHSELTKGSPYDLNNPAFRHRPTSSAATASGPAAGPFTTPTPLQAARFSSNDE